MKENTIELDSLHRQEAELKRRREEAVCKIRHIFLLINVGTVRFRP